jgi:hypothetical protein
MQQMAKRPEAIGEEERSRRRPPRRRSPAPIPVPEAQGPAPKSVRIQDVLEAHHRALESRLDAGLKDLQRAAGEALRSVAEEAARARAGTTTSGGDALRGAVAHAEERFQAITIRLQRLEGAIRQMARAQRETTPVTDPGLAQALSRVEMLVRAVAEIGAEQRDALEKLATVQAQELARLRTEQRTLIRDLQRRTGLGVVAVARRLRQEIADEIQAAIEEPEEELDEELEEAQVTGNDDPEPPEEQPPAARLDPWADPKPARSP